MGGSGSGLPQKCIFDILKTVVHLYTDPNILSHELVHYRLNVSFFYFIFVKIVSTGYYRGSCFFFFFFTIVVSNRIPKGIIGAAWIRFIKSTKPEFVQFKHSVVCSKHFRPSQYYKIFRSPLNTMCLNNQAIPSIMPGIYYTYLFC